MSLNVELTPRLGGEPMRCTLSKLLINEHKDIVTVGEEVTITKTEVDDNGEEVVYQLTYNDTTITPSLSEFGNPFHKRLQPSHPSAKVDPQLIWKHCSFASELEQLNVFRFRIRGSIADGSVDKFDGQPVSKLNACSLQTLMKDKWKFVNGRHNRVCLGHPLSTNEILEDFIFQIRVV
jgi:hypothetical protein